MTPNGVDFSFLVYCTPASGSAPYDTWRPEGHCWHPDDSGHAVNGSAAGPLEKGAFQSLKQLQQMQTCNDK